MLLKRHFNVRRGMYMYNINVTVQSAWYPVVCIKVNKFVNLRFEIRLNRISKLETDFVFHFYRKITKNKKGAPVKFKFIDMK